MSEIENLRAEVEQLRQLALQASGDANWHTVATFKPWELASLQNSIYEVQRETAGSTNPTVALVRYTDGTHTFKVVKK